MSRIKTKLRVAWRIYKGRGFLSVMNVTLKKIFPSGNYFFSWDSRIFFRKTPAAEPSCLNLAVCLCVDDVYSMVGVNYLNKKIIDTAIKRGEKCWVIRLGEEVAAYVWISGAREIIMSDTGYVLKPQEAFAYWWRDVYVAPEHRGQKLPMELFCSWFSSLTDNEKNDIYTEIDPANLHSVNAHLSLGFREIITLYMVCVFGARFYYVSNPILPGFSFRFYPRNVHYSLLSE
jgi:GNAT superfamily N-acetyltransferase